MPRPFGKSVLINNTELCSPSSSRRARVERRPLPGGGVWVYRTPTLRLMVPALAGRAVASWGLRDGGGSGGVRRAPQADAPCASVGANCPATQAHLLSPPTCARHCLALPATDPALQGGLCGLGTPSFAPSTSQTLKHGGGVQGPAPVSLFFPQPCSRPRWPHLLSGPEVPLTPTFVPPSSDPSPDLGSWGEQASRAWGAGNSVCCVDLSKEPKVAPCISPGRLTARILRRGLHAVPTRNHVLSPGTRQTWVTVLTDGAGVAREVPWDF